MPTYLETVKKSYVDVPMTPGVDTMSFLEATEGLVKMFGACAMPALEGLDSAPDQQR